MDGADVCRTSSRASWRPPDVTCGAATLDQRWRRRKWRQPRPGAAFSTPIEEWGARWRPFRFRRPSWMTSFAEPRMRSSKMGAGSGRAAILLLTPQWGSKRPPYTTFRPLVLTIYTLVRIPVQTQTETLIFWWNNLSTKPLPEPMLTYHQIGILTFIWGQFHNRYLSHQSSKLIRKWLIQNFLQISQGPMS